MNFAELSDGVKLAIGFVVLGILIAIVFGAIRYSQTTAEEGSANIENNVSAMTESEFASYDDTIRTGTQVASVAQLYANRDMAVVIKTKRNTAGINYGRQLDGAAPDAAQNDGVGKVVSTSKGFLAEAKYNTNLKNMKDSAHADFVRATAKFTSHLIVDEGGQTVGIHFKQQ